MGVRQGDRVQIVSGLQPGEQVVTSGGLGLDDKAKVTVLAPKAEDEDEDEDQDVDEPKPAARRKQKARTIKARSNERAAHDARAGRKRNCVTEGVQIKQIKG